MRAFSLLVDVSFAATTGPAGRGSPSDCPMLVATAFPEVEASDE